MARPWRDRKPTAPYRRAHIYIEYPHSPWANRFYPGTMPYSSLDENGVLHSSLAPYWPTMPVEALPDGGEVPDQIVQQPHILALDRLFLDERLQALAIGGLRSWQIPALNTRPGPYGPEHHVPRDGNDLGWEVFKSSGFERNEFKWLTIFARERWFDYRVNCFETIENPIPGLTRHKDNWWTVDNQHIWNQLSVSIEIANRLLEQLIAERDPWLDAVIFQPIQYWRHRDPRVMNMYLQNNENNPMFVQQEADVNKRQMPEAIRNQMSVLLSYTVWSFFDEHLEIGLGVTWPLLTITPNKPGAPNPCNLITIQTGCLRSLCNSNLSLVERVNVQMALADTILHETVHALWMGRLIIEKGSTDHNQEPYMWPATGPPETVKELGFSFEKHVFGGTVQAFPQPPDPYTWKGRPLTLCLSTWPLYIGGQDLPPELWQNDVFAHNLINYPLPASWASSFATKDFWNIIVPFFKGSAAFQAPKVFRSETRRDWYTLGQRAFGAKRMRLNENDWFADKYEWSQQVWQNRQVRWDLLRPWYAEEYQKWSSTPWSMAQARATLERFVEAHSTRDQAQCVKQADIFARYVYDYHAKGARGPLTWVYIVIGRLMRAATPLMLDDYLDCHPPRNPGANMHPNSRGVPGSMTVHGIMLNEISFDLSMVYFENFTLDTTIPKSNWISSTIELAEAKALANTERLIHPVPEAWLDVLENTWAELAKWVATNGEPTIMNWPEFTLQVPPYDNDTKWSANHDVLTNREHSPLASPTTMTAKQSYTSLPEPDGPLIGPLRSTAKASVGEVGDHIDSDECTRIIEPDGNCGFDIYDITGASGLCEEAGFADGQDVRTRLLHVGEYGPCLVQGTTDVSESVSPWLRSLIEKSGLKNDLLNSIESTEAKMIRANFGSTMHPLGKLRTRKRMEEIAEYDGRHGMPFWLTIRGCAYDLTTFKHSQRDLDVLRSLVNPLRYKSKNVSDTESKRMLKKIEPRKCAIVQGRPYNFMAQLRPYTLETLARCDNPTFGCYTAIGDYVYDLKTYLDNHPGGRQIIIKYLGEQATEFQDWHSPDILEQVAHLRVGRLVSEIDVNFVEEHEVVIHGWVFDISRLAPDQSQSIADNKIHEQTVKLGGQDASEAIKKNDVMGSALVNLYRRKDLIVGRIKKDQPLKEIPEDELKRHIDPEITTRAWVAVNGQVYDVSTIMIHGKDFYKHSIPKMWAGRILTDDTLARWLSGNYPHYVIGKLVPGPAWPPRKVPDIAAREEEERERYREKQRRKGLYPDNIIPQDIVEWINKTNATPAEFRHQMALRFGLYADTRPDDPTEPCIKLNPDGTNEVPEFARPLKIRKFGDGLSWF
ncbi:hypothetical protein PFICI_12779 [Pestalotiopsis fici W106-1]|uniref:Cytochrome b5 heme-binding domain-containing protein n=1 Tax=Pestalotiopsis fici (strain W106-1 / CGMCC3.15140) TaxID=1229662 RepID=W3WPK8_PESFW|nr:uncharacterized protein PFICI_12779 [Pestalotiopsis fici W106-1]ETS75835.1 hypothetical protein PFICI_12779 [Pestalotiopsis fici W106-1]